MNNSEREELVSIIMSTYNCAEYIKEAIESAINQTYSNWELIIIDDASTDNTLQVVETYKDPRIYIIKNNINLGLAESLNRAIDNSNGVFLCRLDSDDIMLEERIEKQVTYLLEHKDISIVGANIIFFGGKENGYITKFAKESEKLWVKLPFSSTIPHSTWMMRRDLYNEGFGYNPKFRSSQDYELMLRLFKAGKKIACLKEPLVKYRVRGDSISHCRKKCDPNTIIVQTQVAKLLKIKKIKPYIRAINRENENEKHLIFAGMSTLWYLFVIWINNMFLGIFKRTSLTNEIIKRQYAAIHSILKEIRKRKNCKGTISIK